MPVPQIGKLIRTIKSVYLKRDVELEIFISEGLPGNQHMHLLLLNDGQDAGMLQLGETMDSLYVNNKIAPLVAVGIRAAERIQEYGVTGRPDFMGRGSKAQAYTNFIIKELLPYINKEVPVTINGLRAFAGCSLGGLSAFDIAWNNSAYFDVVGTFSASFWWRKKDLIDGYTDSDRIFHEMIREADIRPDLKFWLMTGTEDETADRNNNFIIDSIDDTIDVIKELLRKGYKRPQDITYYEMVGGGHNQETWARALPAFLLWAFGYKH